MTIFFFRKCWTTDVKTENLAMSNKGSVTVYTTVPELDYDTNDIDSFTIFDFTGTEGMKDKLELSSEIASNSDIKWQQETCICDLGDLCNNSTTLKISILTYFILAIKFYL